MLEQNICYFGIICRVASSLQSVLIRWNPTNQNLSLKNNGQGPAFQKSYYLLFCKTLVHALMIVVIIIQGYLTFSDQNNDSTFSDRFLFGVGLVYLLSSHSDLHLCRTQASTICLYVNGMLEFGKRYKNNPRNRKKRQNLLIEDLNRSFAYGFFMTMTLLQVVYLYGLHWKHPCRPSVAAYWLIPECHWNGNQIQKVSCQIWNILLKMVIFLWNHWMWSFSLHTGLFVIAGIQILCSISLGPHIQTYNLS